jgi:hypothetical protein
MRGVQDHYITQFLGYVPWDQASGERNFPLVPGFLVYRKHSWSFQKEAIIYQSFVIVPLFLDGDHHLAAW